RLLVMASTAANSAFAHSDTVPGAVCPWGHTPAKEKAMRQLMLVGSAVVALAVVPFFASTADARMKDNASFGYCKSGTKVADTKNCKENGGTQ
ncbi:MAG: hypothetical protein WA703_10595, partial [Pseudolabrys sp.]